MSINENLLRLVPLGDDDGVPEPEIEEIEEGLAGMDAFWAAVESTEPAPERDLFAEALEAVQSKEAKAAKTLSVVVQPKTMDEILATWSVVCWSYDMLASDQVCLWPFARGEEDEGFSAIDDPGLFTFAACKVSAVEVVESHQIHAVVSKNKSGDVEEYRIYKNTMRHDVNVYHSTSRNKARSSMVDRCRREPCWKSDAS